MTEAFWKQKLDYLHANPCRKGLVRVADYGRFSSATYYLSEGRIKCNVNISGLDWS